ncbi:ribosomal protein L32 [Mycobacterium sp. URHB0021]|jgi:hypothetical protein
MKGPPERIPNAGAVTAKTGLPGRTGAPDESSSPAKTRERRYHSQQKTEETEAERQTAGGNVAASNRRTLRPTAAASNGDAVRNAEQPN